MHVHRTECTLEKYREKIKSSNKKVQESYIGKCTATIWRIPGKWDWNIGKYREIYKSNPGNRFPEWILTLIIIFQDSNLRLSFTQMVKRNLNGVKVNTIWKQPWMGISKWDVIGTGRGTEM